MGGSSCGLGWASSLAPFFDLGSFFGLAAESFGVLVVNFNFVFGVFAGCQQISNGEG